MPLTPGSPVPGIELQNLDGTSVAPAPSGGLPRLLCFVKASCPTCRFALPILDALHESLGRPSGTMLVVAQEDAAQASALAAELGLELGVLLDPTPYAASRAFEVDYVPTCFLVDGGGMVERVSESFVAADLETFNERLAAALGREPGSFHGPDPLPVFRPG